MPPPPGGADKLESFVDMVFGGKFASILVCEKCKKVSLTYEDFNDLSLSIKPEDYVRERKRDRLKQLAKKFRFRAPPSHGGNQLGLSVPMYRSSSVPASPSRRSNDAADVGTEEPPESADTRRKSFEHTRKDSNKSSEEEAKTPPETEPEPDPARPSEETEDGFVKVKSQPESEDGDISEGTTRGGEVTFQEPDIRVGRPKEKASVETKKEKEDPWGKLGRRISTSMRMGKKEKRLSRSADRGAVPAAEPVSAPPTPRKPSKLSSTLDSGSDIADVSDTASRSRGISPSPALSPSPLATPPLSISTPFPGLRRATTEPPRAKSPRPPKPSREEAAYLRRILADVHPSTPSAFSLLQQALSGAATTASPMTAQSLLSKLTHLPGVEECLRMFTAVEIMEGDNMVGCHRCWKIANGTYKPKHHDEREECEEDEREGAEEQPAENKQTDGNENPEETIALPVTESGEISPPDSSPDLGKISPATTAFSSSQSPSTIFLQDDASLSSAPTSSSLGSIQPTVRLVTPAPVVESSSSASLPMPISIPITIPERQASSPPAHVTTFGGLPIPSISTTGPESPSSDPSPAMIAARRESDAIETPPVEFSSFGISLSDPSLLTPRARRISRSSKESKGGSSVGDNSSDSSDDGESFASSASDASGSVSPYSDTSPGASPHSSLEKLKSTLTFGQQQNGEDEKGQGREPLKPTFNRSQTAHPILSSTPTSLAGFSPSLGSPKIPKSQQVIMRRTYKRYLIASPPPVLVVHLKRFQQISRMYAMSFSTGFKKLDEFVAFPEFLDLTPFLAPKREDFGLDGKKKGHKGKKGKKDKEKEKGANGSGKVKEEKCMYRLYAVVVHIGNMVSFRYSVCCFCDLSRVSLGSYSLEATMLRTLRFLKNVHNLLHLSLLHQRVKTLLPLPVLHRLHPQLNRTRSKKQNQLGNQDSGLILAIEL